MPPVLPTKPLLEKGPALDQQDPILARAALVTLAATVLLVLLADPAAAQAINLNPVTTFLTSISDALTGTLGKTIATIALIGVGLTWFFGVIDFRQAMWVIVAIVFVGSAATVVDSLWGSAA